MQCWGLRSLISPFESNLIVFHTCVQKYLAEIWISSISYTVISNYLFKTNLTSRCLPTSGSQLRWGRHATPKFEWPQTAAKLKLESKGIRRCTFHRCVDQSFDNSGRFRSKNRNSWCIPARSQKSSCASVARSTQIDTRVSFLPCLAAERFYEPRRWYLRDWLASIRYLADAADFLTALLSLRTAIHSRNRLIRIIYQLVFIYITRVYNARLFIRICKYRSRRIHVSSLSSLSLDGDTSSQ